MSLIPLQIPPGVFRSDTELESSGRWFDANLVRWYQGTMQPVLGWRKRATTAVTGRPSGLFAWRDNSQNRWLAVGTEQKLYVYESGVTRVDITPVGYTTGRADASNTVGFGTLGYGASGYGVARPLTTTQGISPATAWTLENFGQYLVACANTDGRLYSWALNTATPAAVIAGAPVNNQGLVVTEERFLFALGAGGNPRNIQWADQESLTTWTPAATNQAGDYELQTHGSIVTGRRTRGGTLILTTVDAHLGRYLGPPYVYGFEKVGSGCGIVGVNAVSAIDAGVVWMGTNGFWLFDGYVKPLPCEVGDYVFSDINVNQTSKVATLHNSQFGEVWFLYPSSSSTENDRYAIWNYRENHWAIGKLSRTVGTGQGVFSLPLMMSADGYVYEHDIGFGYDGATPYAESGPLQIGVGDNVLAARQLIPDERTQGQVRATFKAKFYPNAAETSFGPYSMSAPTDVRFTARQVKMKIEPAVPSQWRVGVMRLEGVPGGKR